MVYISELFKKCLFTVPVPCPVAMVVPVPLPMAVLVHVAVPHSYPIFISLTAHDSDLIVDGHLGFTSYTMLPNYLN